MKTIELVLIGHPDKVCDGIAEEIKAANPNGRNAIEVCWFNNLIVVGGEVDKKIDRRKVKKIVHDYLYNKVGLLEEELEKIILEDKLNTQSAEINSIVGNAGAGDNGIFYGGWHKVYSPVIFKLKRLCAKLDATTLAKLGYRTDGKFIADILEDGTISRFVLNIASFKGLMPGRLELESLIYRTMRDMGVVVKDNIQINPRGNWHKCFGFADSGLTGRKLACDTQCGLFHNGGGAWFGKDYSKADFSVPVYLTFRAKDWCENNNALEHEYQANTIIGDEKVIYKTKLGVGEEKSYSDIMKFAKSKKVDIFGGFEELGGVNE